MGSTPQFSVHQAQFFAWELTRRANADTVESLGSTLVDAQVDLNPHQVEAALFACRNPLSRGVILADEVGPGKTIEAGLVLAQFWAERKRRVLIIVPANLRKQWHQELKDKFALDGKIMESKERVRDDSIETRNRFEHLFLDLTRAELNGHATFDADNGFTLHSLLGPTLAGRVRLGPYELPRRTGEAHLYRLGHPLGEYLLEQAKSHVPTAAHLVFDYDAYPKRISTLEPWRGSRGTLVAELLTVSSLAGREQRLVAAAITEDGRVMTDDDPDTLLRLPVSSQTALYAAPEPLPALAADLEQRRSQLAQRINERNLGYFQQEVEKLDAWADDMKVGLEQEIKELDRQIKEVRRTATVAVTLEEKLHWQKAAAGAGTAARADAAGAVRSSRRD